MRGLDGRVAGGVDQVGQPLKERALGSPDIDIEDGGDVGAEHRAHVARRVLCRHQPCDRVVDGIGRRATCDAAVRSRDERVAGGADQAGQPLKERALGSSDMDIKGGGAGGGPEPNASRT